MKDKMLINPQFTTYTRAISVNLMNFSIFINKSQNDISK